MLYHRILAAIEAREQVARQAADGAGHVVWRVGPPKRCQCCNAVITDGRPSYEVLTHDDRLTEHIALNDPASVLRQCSSGVRILQRHASDYFGEEEKWCCKHCCHECESPQAEEHIRWPCADIRDLANIFNVPLQET